MRKILILFLSTLVLLTGCSGSSDTNSDESTVDVTTSEPIETSTVTEETSPNLNVVEYADIKMTIKDGWTYIIDTVKSDWIYFDNKASIDVPVIKVYKDTVDDLNPYFVVSFRDQMEGLGGLFEYKQDFGSIQIGNYNAYVIYNDYAPFSVIYTQIRSEDFYNYDIKMSANTNLTARSLNINYFDHGTSSYDDSDVLEMISSIEVANSIGKATVTADNLNVRVSDSTESTKIWLAHKTYEFEVYEVKEASDYIWYRVGTYSWIASKANEWVDYSQY